MEEAARSLGSGAWATFSRVTLPQLRPGIVAGALLVALYCLSDFGVVSLLQYDSFSNEIYIQYRSAFDRTPAAILALMLVTLTIAVLLVEGRTRGRARYHGNAASRPAAHGRPRALAPAGAPVLRRGRPVRARGPRRGARVLARAGAGRGRAAAPVVERGVELRLRLRAGRGGDGAGGVAGGDPVGQVQGKGLGARGEGDVPRVRAARDRARALARLFRGELRAVGLPDARVCWCSRTRSTSCRRPSGPPGRRSCRSGRASRRPRAGSGAGPRGSRRP